MDLDLLNNRKAAVSGQHMCCDGSCGICRVFWVLFWRIWPIQFRCFLSSRICPSFNKIQKKQRIDEVFHWKRWNFVDFQFFKGISLNASNKCHITDTFLLLRGHFDSIDGTGHLYFKNKVQFACTEMTKTPRDGRRPFADSNWSTDIGTRTIIIIFVSFRVGLCSFGLRSRLVDKMLWFLEFSGI